MFLSSRTVTADGTVTGGNSLGFKHGAVQQRDLNGSRALVEVLSIGM
jgi:hypothetical protein